MPTNRKTDTMFPDGDDTPLLSGTPVSVDVPTAPLPAVDPGAPGGDQNVLFIAEVPFDPGAIMGTLSSGTWNVVEGRALISGYGYQVKTLSPRGTSFPVALAVTAADAAVLAQAKRLLALVVRAYQVPANEVADPEWEAFRNDARRALLDCAAAPTRE